MKIQDAFPLLKGYEEWHPDVVKLRWYQKLWLFIVRKTGLHLSYTRGTSKTGLEMMVMFERLKQKAKTNEEKQMLEQMQKEFGETMHDLTMSFWNNF
jgi:hypothetical protein